MSDIELDKYNTLIQTFINDNGVTRSMNEDTYKLFKTFFMGERIFNENSWINWKNTITPKEETDTVVHKYGISLEDYKREMLMEAFAIYTGKSKTTEDDDIYEEEPKIEVTTKKHKYRRYSEKQQLDIMTSWITAVEEQIHELDVERNSLKKRLIALQQLQVLS